MRLALGQAALDEAKIRGEAVTRLRMNAVQCKMARAAVGMGVRELAGAAKVSPDTVALVAAGVEFTNGDQPGLRMKKFKLRDAGQKAFHCDGSNFYWFWCSRQPWEITVIVQDLALQHLDPKIGGRADHVRTVEEHRSKLFEIAARKYELGHIEPCEIVSIKLPTLTDSLDGDFINVPRVHQQRAAGREAAGGGAMS